MEDFEVQDGLRIWLNWMKFLKADGSLKEHVVYAFEYCAVSYACTVEGADIITLYREDMGFLSKKVITPRQRTDYEAVVWMLGEVCEFLTDKCPYHSYLSRSATNRAIAHKAKRLKQHGIGPELAETFIRQYATPIADQ